MYACMYVCMYVCMYACMYVCNCLVLRCLGTLSVSFGLEALRQSSRSGVEWSGVEWSGVEWN
jgi:hypothetical protein